MKKISSLAILLGIALAFNACYYDKANLLYPNSTGAGGVCDTVAVVSYSKHVVPILQTACYSCHTVTNASGGIPMASYATDKAIAVNGKLYGSINHAAGYSPMPKGAAKFNSCQLATIKKWIDAGSLNN